MVALLSAVVATLTLDAPPLSWDDSSCTTTDQSQCTLERHDAAGARVSIVRTGDGMGDSLAIVLGTSLFDLVYFDRADSHHSETWLDERERRLRFTTGSLDGGDRGLVVLVAIVATVWDEESLIKGTGKVRSVGHAASVVVCDLDHSTCTRPVRVACPARGCTASLAKGVLTVSARRRSIYDVQAP
jgi:hypothetical protein